MTVTEQEASLRVHVARDRTEARLKVPASFDRALLTLDLCRLLLQEQEVAWTREVDEAVRSLIASATDASEDVEGVVATATPPVHGEDAILQWLVDDAKATACEEQSFYDRSAYVMVKQGQILGRVTLPTPGVDGRDVTGKNLAARPGRGLPLRIGASILQNSRGELIAQVSGVLIRTPGEAVIGQLLEVPQCVDFSTGNIEFEGDVLVHDMVCDRFVIRAGGNVEVRGQIEAATIVCGGDLCARGGMAGREQGSLDVGGRVLAKYLSSVRGKIHKNLLLEREAINSLLEVGGEVHAPQGTIIGGELTAAGAVHVANLGSDGGVRTRLVLGRMPSLEQTEQRLTQMLSQLRVRREALLEDQRKLARDPHPSPMDKERQTEVLFELQQTDENLAKVTAGIETMRQRIARHRRVDLRVTATLFQGVELVAGDRIYRIHENVQGPLRIWTDSSGELLIRRGEGQPGPLSQYAKLQTAAGARGLTAGNTDQRRA